MNTIIMLLLCLLLLLVLKNQSGYPEDEFEYNRHVQVQRDPIPYLRVYGIGEKNVSIAYNTKEWTPIKLELKGDKLYPEHTCCGEEYFVRLRNDEFDKTCIFECEKCRKIYGWVEEKSSESA